MATTISLGDRERCLAEALDRSCVNSSRFDWRTTLPPTSSDESEDDKPFIELLVDASGATNAKLPISELPAAIPDVESSPKRAVLSEFGVVISTMKTEGRRTNALRLNDEELYG